MDHFLAQSYQCLEQLENLRDHSHGVNGGRQASREEARAFLNECSLRALNISLRAENLSNLERGRLLDILLWAGELSEALRLPAAKFSFDADRRDSSSSANSAS